MGEFSRPHLGGVLAAGFALGVLSGVFDLCSQVGASALSSAQPSEAVPNPLATEASELETVALVGGSLTNLTELERDGSRYLFEGVGSRFMVFDVSKAGAPEKIGESDLLPGYPTQLLAESAYLYVLVYRHGLFIFDISTPGSPEIVGRLLSVGSASQSLAYRDGMVYLLDPESGLCVVDAKDVTSPRLIGTLSFRSGDSAEYLELEAMVGRGDQIALIADDPRDSRVLLLLDASVPEQIVELSRLPYRAGQPRGAVWHGEHVYVGDGNGILVFDVGDLKAPELVTLVPRPEDEVSLWTLHGNPPKLYQTGERPRGGPSVMFEYDLADPGAPSPVAVYDNGPWGVLHFSRGRLYSSVDNRGSIGLYEISPTSGPVFRSRVQLPGSVSDIATNDGRLYALTSGGLTTFALEDPVPMLGRWLMPWSASRFVCAGDLLFVAAGKDGLRVLDMENPTAPVLVGVVPVEGDNLWGFKNIALDGVRGYAIVRVSRQPTELWVIDFSDPSSPDVMGTVQMDLGWNRMPPIAAIGATVLLGSDQASGREIVSVDVSEPSAPQEVGRLALSGHVWSLEPGAGSTMYAGTDEGILVLDVADPTHVSERGFVSTSDDDGDRAVHGLAFAGTRLYASLAYPPPPADDEKGATVVPFEVVAPWELRMLDGVDAPAWFRSGHSNRAVVGGPYVVANGGAMGSTVVRRLTAADEAPALYMPLVTHQVP